MARREEEDAGLSLTPLVDVVLLLLIFYIVTTAFVDREIELQLPESQASSVPEEKKKFTVELGRGSDDLALNGERITVEGLDKRIGAEAASDSIKAVEIRADTQVIHGRVVEVLGIVKKHGVDNVGIAVRQAES
jgi:biopolymer transport protein ExbD